MRQRGGRGRERARGELAQPVGVLEGAGEAGLERSVHGRGGGDVSMKNTTIPATACYGEDSYGSAMFQRGCGWRESSRGASVVEESSRARAAEAGSIPAMEGFPGSTARGAGS